jgi:phosphoserine phosphatase RsbU/P
MPDPKKILIVDDSRINLKVLTDVLKAEYKIMAAKNGEQALQAAVKNPLPDLILLDIMMPDMDGFEVCRRLKANAATREIPIIFVTGLDESTDEAKGLELGAVDYITKPISPPIVKARVKSHLALKHNMDALKEAYQIIDSQKKRMEAELNVGYEIQMSRIPTTFPPFPERTEFSISAILHPAREVGGDFYDFFFIDDNRLCFCIGDAAGKGVPSALFMAETKVLIRSRAKVDSSTASIITHINDELSQNNETTMFITLFIGILNVSNGELLFTNAGHNPPYLIRHGSQPELMDNRHGTVVGALENMVFKEDTLTLSKGDFIFLYTDGVTESKNQQSEFFTDQRLSELLAAQPYTSAEDMVKTVANEVKKHEDDSEQTDDITILAVQQL